MLWHFSQFNVDLFSHFLSPDDVVVSVSLPKFEDLDLPRFEMSNINGGLGGCDFDKSIGLVHVDPSYVLTARNFVKGVVFNIGLDSGENLRVEVMDFIRDGGNNQVNDLERLVNAAEQVRDVLAKDDLILPKHFFDSAYKIALRAFISGESVSTVEFYKLRSLAQKYAASSGEKFSIDEHSFVKEYVPAYGYRFFWNKFKIFK